LCSGCRHLKDPPRFYLRAVLLAGAVVFTMHLMGSRGIVTASSLVFIVAPNTSAAFALLQDMSISLYMLMYIRMFAAAIKLRRSQPEVARRIRIIGLPAIAVVGMFSAVSAIILGLTPPAGYSSLSATTYAIIVATGVIVLGIPPQFIYRFRKPSWKTDVAAVSEIESDA
jgi:amino acid transporter